MSGRFENPFAHLEEATISELQAAMDSGQFTARRLAEMYLERIQALDKSGPTLNSILEVNPAVLEIANALDQERQARGPRGPLHGIPLLLKDNIATADRMQTTAGSLALLGSRPPRDAFVVSRLRDAGAVILGKTNLSEWANFRSAGSSSGSAVAVAANLAVASLGTETDGSILFPASTNGVVGIKPTVGLTSRAGVIPVAHSQDSIGPFGRTVTDAAILLGAITGIDQRDPATQESAGKFHTDYTQFLDLDGLRGARLGIARQVYFGYSTKTDAIVNAAIEQMRNLGAEIIDPADIPTAEQISSSKSEDSVLLYEFKVDLNAYLAELLESPVRSLADIIAFNNDHAEEELK